MAFQQKKSIDFGELPTQVKKFLYYLETIQGKSKLTVAEYGKDLRLFYRFLHAYRGKMILDDKLTEIDVSADGLDIIDKCTTEEIYEFLHYLADARKNQAATRARKLSTLKVYFQYLTVKVNLLKTDPTAGVDTPRLKKKQPKYLNIDEATEFLSNIKTEFSERDYCAATLFMNCGMRLSELVGIDLPDINENTIRILGKGNKERTIYLNDACKDALRIYIDARAKIPSAEKKALFISRRTGNRLSPRRIEQIMKDCFALSGLSDRGFSPHKLRHTAATLMYQGGAADILALKEILGHEHVSTTEIYTHINNRQLADAVNQSPLAHLKQ